MHRLSLNQLPPKMDVAATLKTAAKLAGIPGVAAPAGAIVTLTEECENIQKRKQVPSGYLFY